MFWISWLVFIFALLMLSPILGIGLVLFTIVALLWYGLLIVIDFFTNLHSDRKLSERREKQAREYGMRNVGDGYERWDREEQKWKHYE